VCLWGGIGSPSRHVCSKPQVDPDVKRKYSHIWTIDYQCYSMLVACARDIESSRSNNCANFISSWCSSRGPTQVHTLVNPCKSHAKLPRVDPMQEPCQLLGLTQVATRVKPVEKHGAGEGVDMC